MNNHNCNGIDQISEITAYLKVNDLTTTGIVSDGVVGKSISTGTISTINSYPDHRYVITDRVDSNYATSALASTPAPTEKDCTKRITDKNSKTHLMKEWVLPNGTIWKSQVLIPKITKIEVFNNRAVKVTFADGTFTKTVCQEGDTFNLELGLLYCLIEKREGRSDYLKMLKYALKRKKEIELAEQKAKEDEKEKKAMLARRKAKYARKKARREERRSSEKSSTKKKSNGNNRKDSK